MPVTCVTSRRRCGNLFWYMRDVTTKNFGLLIAYILPGFALLWGASYHSETLRGWLGQTAADGTTVGGFLYVALGSVAVGMTASTVRWLVLDSIHHRTGIPQPPWDFSQLPDRVSAFEALNEIHYRYYQFYGNGLVALIGAAWLRWFSVGFRWSELLAVALLCGLFYLGSRDTLQKYYARVAGVLGTNPRNDEHMEPNSGGDDPKLPG